MQNKQIPPFNIHSRCHYFVGHLFSDDITMATKIKGPLDYELFKQAALTMIAKTPLLETRIRPCLFFITRKWIKAHGQAASAAIVRLGEISDNSIGACDSTANPHVREFINDQLNVEKESPIRIMLAKIKNQKNVHLLLVKVHHSATDGIGAYQIMSALFQEYNALMGVANAIALPPQPASYKLEITKKYLTPEDMKMKINTAILKEPIAYYRDTAQLTGTLKNRVYLFSPHEFKAMKKLTAQSKYNINDILTACIVASLYKTIVKHSPEAKLLRFAQTVSLRKYLHTTGGIGNLSTTVHSHFRPENFKNIQTTLEAVYREKKNFQTTKEDIKSVFGMRILKFIPSRVVRWLIRRHDYQNFKNHPFLTGIISNLGSLDCLVETPTDCSIEFAWVMTPVHFSYGMQWFITTINNTIALNLAYLDPVITESTAASLLKQCSRELQSFTKGKKKRVARSEKTKKTS